MSKRFTDTKKWDDPWFAELPSKYKLFWLYLLDECDHAGVWKVNFRKAQFMIGESLEQAEVFRYLSDRIKKIDETYWLVLKFIDFQYGVLKNDNVSISVCKILDKHGLTEFANSKKQAPAKGLSSPSQGAKDKDKDKDKVMVKDKDKDNGEYTRPRSIDDPELIRFFENNGSTKDEALKFFTYYDSQNWHKSNNMPISKWESAAIRWITESLHNPNFNKKKETDYDEEARKFYKVER